MYKYNFMPVSDQISSNEKQIWIYVKSRRIQRMKISKNIPQIFFKVIFYEELQLDFSGEMFVTDKIKWFVIIGSLQISLKIYITIFDDKNKILNY